MIEENSRYNHISSPRGTSSGRQNHNYNFKPLAPRRYQHNNNQGISHMKLKFPPPGVYTKAVGIGAAIGIIGYLLFPLILHPAQELNRPLFALLLYVGAILGIIVTGFTLLPSPAPRTSTTTSSAAEGGRKTVFVGNLAFKANRDELRQLFERYGSVYSVRIMTDRITRRPRGFAFVEMDEKAVAAAIKGLDGQEFYGRNLRVNEGSDQRPPREG